MVKKEMIWCSTFINDITPILELENIIFMDFDRVWVPHHVVCEWDGQKVWGCY
jgi:hypothetical protein